jgi:hypothetical protein
MSLFITLLHMPTAFNRVARVARSVFSRHFRFDCGYSPDLVGQFAFRIPSIICALHSRPDSGAIAEQFTEPDSNGRGNRFALVEDIVEMLAGDTKQGGDHPQVPSSLELQVSPNARLCSCVQKRNRMPRRQNRSAPI